MRLFITLAVCLTSTVAIAKSTQWQNLAKGVDYTVINYEQPYVTSKIHALRIDPKLYTFHIINASHIERKAGLAATFAKISNSLITINGGFFNPDYEPLGLRISGGRVLTPFKSISWWGIFTIKDKQPAIITPSQFEPAKQYEFAIQAGPRLLTDGKIIPKLKDIADSRSALCITYNQQVIIVVTEHLPLTTTALASKIRLPESQGGLACKDALNLDGGHSSQLYANIGDKVINVPNLSPIADVIAVRSI